MPSDRVRSSLRPLIAAFQEAAGRYGDLRIGCISSARAFELENDVWFSRSRSFDHCAHSGRRLPTPSLTEASSCGDAYPSCSHDSRRISIIFFLRHHRPDRPRHFVPKRDRDQHERLAVQHPSQHDPSTIDLRASTVRRDMAPMINNDRISVCPAFDTRPSRSLPPEAYWRGTRPSQAAKSRPRLKLSIGGAKPLMATRSAARRRALSAIVALYRSPGKEPWPSPFWRRSELSFQRSAQLGRSIPRARAQVDHCWALREFPQFA